jgi:hypothetical protein
LLAKLGLDQNRPWALVAHGDTEHKHAHLVTSRTAYDGSVWYGHWEVNNLLRAKAEVEREFGLQITPLDLETPKSTRGKLWEMSRAIEDGQPVTLSSKRDLAAEIDQAIAESGGDADNFQKKLAKAGVEVKLNQSKTTGRIAGASFRTEGADWFKGSQLGKAYTWAKISERITTIAEPQNKPAHETERIEAEPIEHGVIEPRDPTAAERTPGAPGASPATSREIGSRPSGADGINALKAVEFPDFSAFRTYGPSSDAAAERPAASRADRGHDTSTSVVQNSERPAAVAFLKVVTDLFSAAMAIAARIWGKRRRSVIGMDADELPTPRHQPEIERHMDLPPL